MLARGVRDEPDWRDILHVEPIEPRIGAANQKPPCGGRRRRAMPLGGGAAYAQLLTDR
jgi:hypothetical protein